MTYQEFIDRTAAPISEQFYHDVIEPAYYEFDGFKDAFCYNYLIKEICNNRELLKELASDQMLRDVYETAFGITTASLSELIAKQTAKANQLVKYVY